MSPARRLLLTAVALVVGVVALTAVVARLLAPPERPVAAARQDLPGPVLLVPGYGGATGALEVLAGTLRAAGRDARVLRLPGDGRGDLRASAEVLQEAVEATGAPSVDVVGYSAGGVVARLWAAEHPERARRVVTLGSPHHGTGVAALGAALARGACPVACEQLVPGSPLLDALNEGDETPPGPLWLSVWTEQDRVVTPPDSARLEGAVNVAVQDVCPGAAVDHGALPTAPVVRGLVLEALSGPAIAAPTAADCARLAA